MKIKEVTQFTCDFCGKKRYRKHVMERHEKYCTANPNRGCRMCGKESTDVQSIGRQINSMTLPCFGSEDWTRIENENLSKLKDLVGGCPACVLAVLRCCMVSASFAFKDECKAWWDAHPKEELQDYPPGGLA